MKKLMLAVFVVAMGFSSANAYIGMPQQPTTMEFAEGVVFDTGNNQGQVPTVTPVPEKTSAFLQLGEAFKAGTVPTQADLTGYHSGRSYLKKSPNYPAAVILVGRITTATGLPANLAPAEFFLDVVYAAQSRPADYYDKLTQEKKRDLTDVLAKPPFPEPAKFGTDGVSVSCEKFIMTVRKSGNYLVLEVRVKDGVYGYAYFELKSK